MANLRIFMRLKYILATYPLFHPQNILGQKFLHSGKISIEIRNFSLKIGLSQLKQLSRNFCTRSEICANFETFNTPLF